MSSIAFFSANDTIKVNGYVNAQGTSSTLYTAPANGYAVVQITAVAAGSGVTLDGKRVDDSSKTVTHNVFVGPGRSLVAGTGTYAVTGVEFINTP